MQGSQQGFFNAEYYRRRKFQYDLSYPSLIFVAGTLVEQYDPERVLVVGCATGLLVRAFHELGLEAYGVDFSEHAISQAAPEIRHRLIKANVDYELLPFADGAFDLVDASEILEHLANHRHLLRELARVLRDGGVVLAAGRRRARVTIGTVFGTNDFGHFGSNPTHINRQPNSFWIREFEAHGFDYVGDLPRQAVKEFLRLSHPLSDTGQLLMRCGAPGRRLRAEFAYAMRRKSMIFRKAGSDAIGERSQQAKTQAQECG
jgi:SAM-dependent methyltransferase